jgi:hypothetical protein
MSTPCRALTYPNGHAHSARPLSDRSFGIFPDSESTESLTFEHHQETEQAANECGTGRQGTSIEDRLPLVSRSLASQLLLNTPLRKHRAGERGPVQALNRESTSPSAVKRIMRAG